jgi:hypothetical protein
LHLAEPGKPRSWAYAAAWLSTVTRDFETEPKVFAAARTDHSEIVVFDRQSG